MSEMGRRQLGRRKSGLRRREKRRRACPRGRAIGAIVEKGEKVSAIADRGMKRHAGKLEPIPAHALLHGQGSATDRLLTETDRTMALVCLFSPRGAATLCCPRWPSPRRLAHARGAAPHLPNARRMLRPESGRPSQVSVIERRRNIV
jgi:hypothetical protein